jgi:hypothetical protein
MKIKYTGKCTLQHDVVGTISEGFEMDIDDCNKNYWLKLTDKLGNKLFIEVKAEIKPEKVILSPVKKTAKKLKMVIEEDGE